MRGALVRWLPSRVRCRVWGGNLGHFLLTRGYGFCSWRVFFRNRFRLWRRGFSGLCRRLFSANYLRGCLCWGDVTTFRLRCLGWFLYLGNLIVRLPLRRSGDFLFSLSGVFLWLGIFHLNRFLNGHRFLARRHGFLRNAFLPFDRFRSRTVFRSFCHACRASPVTPVSWWIGSTAAAFRFRAPCVLSRGRLVGTAGSFI